MYICFYVCMYVCMYVCLCLNVCMYICMYVCMYVCIYVLCIFVCTYICMYISIYVFMYVCMYVYKYVCMYVRLIHCLLRPPHPQSLYTVTQFRTALQCSNFIMPERHCIALHSGKQTYCSLFGFIPSTPSFLVRFINYCNYCVMVHSSFALA